MLKKIGVVLLLIAISIWISQISSCVKSNYLFEKKYSYAWNLSDKSSTIEAKAAYINEFVGSLVSNKEYFSDYNAIWLKTPNNNFEYNLKAITTLKNRLMEIKEMDITSFQYNTAIQQITAQEQGEAYKLISIIQGCYDLKNYWYVWDWFGLIIIIFSFVLFFAGSVLINAMI